MAKILREFAESGLLNIVGGCCGTTPEHIRPSAAAMQTHRAPRAVRPTALRAAHSFSGLETLAITPESQLHHDRRTHQRHRLGTFPTPDQGRRLRDGAGGGARPGTRKRRQQIIDVNMDEGLLDSEAA